MVLDSFDAEERAYLEIDVGGAKSIESEWKSFYKAVSQYKADKRGVPEVFSKSHPSHGRKYKALPAGPPSDDLHQVAAKVRMPPGTFLWRDNTRGAWLVQLRPMKPNHGGSSYQALFAALT